MVEKLAIGKCPTIVSYFMLYYYFLSGTIAVLFHPDPVNDALVGFSKNCGDP